MFAPVRRGNKNWKDEPGAVVFGRECPLGPAHRAPMRVRGQRFFHVEGWMQSRKHAGNPEFADHIRRTESAGQAREMGGARLLWADLDAGKRELRPREVEAWDATKVDVLLEGLRAKFEQHPDLRTLLADTGTAPLVFDAEAPWGCGPGGTGANVLGRALADVRRGCHMMGTQSAKVDSAWGPRDGRTPPSSGVAGGSKVRRALT